MEKRVSDEPSFIMHGSLIDLGRGQRGAGAKALNVMVGNSSASIVVKKRFVRRGI